MPTSPTESPQINTEASKSKKALKRNSFSGDADKAHDTKFLRFAKRHPKTYLKIVGHLLVMSELIALLTPSVAMGIQWVTALCDGPPAVAFVELIFLWVNCARFGECEFSQDDFVQKNCILKQQ
eukprot:gene43542-54084_t